MKRLLCRWTEYYLALCEDDIERGLPGWVRRHVQACAHCQGELQTYRRAREAVRQYARLLPDAPREGWRPLQVTREVRRRTLPLQMALAPVAVVVVAVLGFVLWQRVSPPIGDMGNTPQMAQSVSPMQQDDTPGKRPAAPAATPSTKGNKPKQEPPKQPASPQQSKPAPSPHQTPPAPVHHPPKRILVATQPATQVVHEAETQPAAEPQSEPNVPVQPVLVEASPSPSRDIPEAFVIQPAYAAAAGGVE